MLDLAAKGISELIAIQAAVLGDLLAPKEL